MYKNILNFINSTYKAVNDYGFDNVDPQLVRYFRTIFCTKTCKLMAYSTHVYSSEFWKPDNRFFFTDS